MNFVVLGTSEFTVALTKALVAEGQTVSALISVPADARPLNSVDIASVARSCHAKYFEVSDINSIESLAFLRKEAPDYILCTWPWIIGSDVLAVPKYFVIGTHPTSLPKNRGRHPLHWIVDLGIKETKLSFFVMDQGVDSGDILLQVPISVDEFDSITDLNKKAVHAGESGIHQLMHYLTAGNEVTVQVQDHDEATYWRKRTPFDITIDFRMPAKNILRTVRSYVPPYPAAKIIFQKHIINIIGGEIIQAAYPHESVMQMEPGKILSTDDHSITVKAADEVVRLVSEQPLPFEIRQGKYIHPPAKYIAETGDCLIPFLGL